MTAFTWALVTACIWGVVPILEKSGLAKASPFAALFYRCLGVIIGIVLLSIFIVKPAEIRSVDIKSILLLVLAGFLASFVAQITFYHALKIGEVSKVVPIAGTYYLISFLLGIIVMGETITLSKISGIFLIAAGMFLLR